MMKYYFKFNLTGLALFPIWVCYLLFLLSPYIHLLYQFHIISPPNISPNWSSLIVFSIFAIVLVLLFYLTKLIIENIEIKDQTFKFQASILGFVGILFVNTLLLMITFGIYTPWFLRNMHRYFSKSVSYNGGNFNFMGRGTYLLLIFIFALIIPVFIVSSFVLHYYIGDVFITAGKINIGQLQKVGITQKIIMVFVIIPYTYLFYNWLFNFTYKNYFINWETDFWLACGKIFVELFLSFITIGIYLPMAILKIYKYFVERTVMQSVERDYHFGFELDAKNDYIFILKQVLLSIVTIGFYYPWAICKVAALVMRKTFAEHLINEQIMDEQNTNEQENSSVIDMAH